MSTGARQVPAAGEVVLDHVGLFTPDIEVASRSLARLGFRLTPFTPQRHRLAPDRPLVDAGTGNRLALLADGYLEVLAPVGDTPLADQMWQAIDRYVGLHLVAFGPADAEAAQAELLERGFPAEPVIRLERTLPASLGGGTVRFSVVRVTPGTMPEGRIQYCRHETPELIWQEDWIVQPNRARALTDVLLVVSDPEEAARRFGRFVGRVPYRGRHAPWLLPLDRGRLTFVDPGRLRQLLPRPEAPAMPFVAAVAVTSDNLVATREVLAQGEVDFHAGPEQALVARVPDMAATVVFTAEGALPPWLAPRDLHA